MTTEIRPTHISGIHQVKEMLRPIVPPEIWDAAKGLKTRFDAGRTYPQDITVLVDGVAARYLVTGPTEYDRVKTLVSERRYLLDILGNTNLNTVCWNVGASVGTSCIPIGLKASQGRVVAIEPDPESLARLTLNAKGLNKLENIQLVPYAVSNENGIIRLNRSSCGLEGPTPFTGNSRVGQKCDSSLLVQAYTLDHLSRLYSEPDILIIDVEGDEMKVLCGMNVIKPKHIFVEAHLNLGVSTKQITELLYSKGYVCMRQYIRGTERLMQFDSKK